MAEYKDVEPLKKQIADFKYAVSVVSAGKSLNSDYLTGYISALSAVEGAIADQPAADVEPVRHGEWEYQPPTATLNGAWKCTACKCYFWEHTANEFKYCPNCGAKMNKNP